MAGGMKKRRKYLEIAILLTCDSFFFSYYEDLFILDFWFFVRL